MPSPNISGSPANFLETVSCIGTKFCMASLTLVEKLS